MRNGESPTLPGNISSGLPGSVPAEARQQQTELTIRVHVCTADALPPGVIRRLARSAKCEVITHQGMEGLLASLTGAQSLGAPPPVTTHLPAGGTETNGRVAAAASQAPGETWTTANCAVLTTEVLAGEASSSDPSSCEGRVRDLIQRWFTPVVIVPRGADGDRGAMAAMRAGARDFIDLDTSEDSALEVLRGLVRGAVEDWLQRKDKREASDQIASLTPRERQVMLHLSAGLDTKEVAAQLHLAVKTVENHRAKLLGKLDARSQIEMARIAWVAGETCEIESDPQRLRTAARVRQQLMGSS